MLGVIIGIFDKLVERDNHSRGHNAPGRCTQRRRARGKSRVLLDGRCYANFLEWTLSIGRSRSYDQPCYSPRQTGKSKNRKAVLLIFARSLPHGSLAVSFTTTFDSPRCPDSVRTPPPISTVSPPQPRTFPTNMSLPRLIRPLLTRRGHVLWHIPTALLGHPPLSLPTLKPQKTTANASPPAPCPPTSYPPSSLRPCKSLSARTSYANPSPVWTTLPVPPPRTSKRCPTTPPPHQSSCVARLHPPSISPSSPTLATQILSLLATSVGHPLILTVLRLPRVSGMVMACPPHTLLSWVALQEVPLLPALLMSTGTALLETLHRIPNPICPGQTLSLPSGLRSFLPPLVPRRPSGHPPYNPSTVLVLLPMPPRLNLVL